MNPSAGLVLPALASSAAYASRPWPHRLGVPRLPRVARCLVLLALRRQSATGATSGSGPQASFWDVLRAASSRRRLGGLLPFQLAAGTPAAGGCPCPSRLSVPAPTRAAAAVLAFGLDLARARASQTVAAQTVASQTVASSRPSASADRRRPGPAGTAGSGPAGPAAPAPAAVARARAAAADSRARRRPLQAPAVPAGSCTVCQPAAAAPRPPACCVVPVPVLAPVLGDALAGRDRPARRARRQAGPVGPGPGPPRTATGADGPAVRPPRRMTSAWTPCGRARVPPSRSGSVVPAALAYSASRRRRRRDQPGSPLGQVPGAGAPRPARHQDGSASSAGVLAERRAAPAGRVATARRWSAAPDERAVGSWLVTDVDPSGGFTRRRRHGSPARPGAAGVRDLLGRAAGLVVLRRRAAGRAGPVPRGVRRRRAGRGGDDPRPAAVVAGPRGPGARASPRSRSRPSTGAAASAAG